jgi:hypothetical protein
VLVPRVALAVPPRRQVTLDPNASFVYVRVVKEIDLGRYVFGVSAIAFGVVAFVWRDFNIWQQIRPLGAAWIVADFLRAQRSMNW